MSLEFDLALNQVQRDMLQEALLENGCSIVRKR